MTDIQADYGSPEKGSGKSNCGKYLLFGCIGVLVICIAGGVWISMNWKRWIAEAAREGMVAGIEQSDLPEEQKKAVIVQIDRLTNGFIDGDISVEQVLQIMEELADGPLLPVGIVYAAKVKYVEPSDMTDEEKADAWMHMQRFARGVFEDKISDEDVQSINDRISTKDSEGNINYHDRLSRQELDDLIADAKKMADDAGIPNEEYEIDLAGEVSRAIDRALSDEPASTDGEEPTSTDGE